MALSLGAVLAGLVVIAGALSIPFLNSPSLSVLDDYREGLVPILNQSMNTSEFSETDAKNYPGSVKKMFGPDSFYFETQTAFGLFSVEIANTNELILVERLVNNDVKITRIVENNETLRETWELKTDEYTLKSSKMYSRVEEEFTTPNGFCRKVKDLGTVEEECSGIVDSIEDEWDEAKVLLNDYAQKMQEVLEEVSLPNVRVGLSTSQFDY